ncbi:Coiled-coil domain containing protein 151 [Daphnia magna]|uniref:Coiled-coil domain containing protein 151 n=1 Tax=Daphnia magna TaxID=35525 RepID=A0A164SUT5_9CRUS|nr:Coiled-coil domain containing protein 151 [Daphnia magna]
MFKQIDSYLASIPGHYKLIDEEVTLTEIQSIRQKMVEAYHIQRQYKTILDVISGERIGYESQLIELEKSAADSKVEAAKLKQVREAAKRARDVAKTELQHHEETLVASTRETDRLLSDYNCIALLCLHCSFSLLFIYYPIKHGLAQSSISLNRGRGAADVRSTIRIVESQKEKCDELRQQFHVLQERVQYLAQLKETLLVRLNQLLEAHCLSSSNSTRPTPRLLDELFADDGSLATPRYKTASINGEYQIAQEDEEQIDYNEALRSVASAIIKICSQIPVGPPVEEANYPAESAVITDHLNVLNLLESKLSALMELVKSLDAIKAEPSTVNGNPNPDLLYSQMGQLSLPPSPRPAEPKLTQPNDGCGTTAAAGAAATTVATDRAGRVSNPKLRVGNDSGSDEDQVPTRGFLKRQTRIIVDAKTKKQNQRPRKND